MKKATAKISQTIIGAGLFVLLLTTFINPSHCQAFDASINISPNIINIESTDHTFGIHTDVPYSIVNLDTVMLACPEDTDLYPLVCYADSRGYLVAKFSTADLEADCELTIGADNTLVLVGETKEPVEPFSGAGDVLIIENQAAQQQGNGPKATQKKWGQNR